MRSISRSEIAYISGGKEVPGYGKAGGIPGPNTRPVPIGGNRLGAVIGVGLWVFGNGMWELLGPAKNDAEFLQNQRSAGGGQISDAPGASVGDPGRTDDPLRRHKNDGGVL